MKIKAKLTLGVGLLFILILLLAFLSTWYINVLKSDTQNILVSNYNTMDYAQSMLMDLEHINENTISDFDLNLKNQEHNITEVGEKEATFSLRNNFDKYKLNKDDSILVLIRKDIYQIMKLNMLAIQRKSDLAISNASNANTYVSITGTLCFLIAFILLVNLPSNIANPIKELSKSIKLIANKQYSERVHFEHHNEFGELALSFNAMAEKLQEYNNSNLAKLMIEKKRVETLINNMHDPVIGLDENLKILFVNEEAINIIGLPYEALIGRDALQLAVNNDLIRLFIKDFSDEKDTQIPIIKSPLKIFSNGKESYFEKENIQIHITPTGESNDQFIGYVIMLRNVTEYKELDFAKTNFLATVSHEFKTPISSIRMSLRLLENDRIGKLNDEQKTLVNSIQDDTSRLLKITGELLNLTQVETGNMQLDLVSVHPNEIIEMGINATQTQADNKNIKLISQIKDDVNDLILDKEKTTWVLTNLITNAIRYSYENSSVLIECSEENNHLYIKVNDQGQGIPSQYVDKIFNRYYRVPGNTSEGTGLGLAISKEFIEAQGGRIFVKSEHGSGSEFTIEFPII
jgi:PAS domain S-box-containing protein